MSATSVLVPPMSKVIQSSIPAISQIRTAPPAPPTGPDRKVPAANLAAWSSVITPPLDPITFTGAEIPCPFNSPANVSRYVEITGVKYALSTQVENRSNSPFSGTTPVDAHTGVSPASA